MRPFLLACFAVALAVLILHSLRRRTEAWGDWYEPEDGLPPVDERPMQLLDFLRGEQHGQPTFQLVRHSWLS